MKTSILISFILCSICPMFTKEKGRESKHNISKRSAQVIQIAIDELIQTSAHLKTAYANNDLTSAADVALALVERIPIIGDVVYLLNNDPDPSFDVESGLITINDNLKVLNNNIKKIGIRVEELSKTIDLSVMKNQVAIDKREISNCYEDFLLFLPNPLSNAEKDRLKHCYSKFSFVRQIGSILKNEKLTFMQEPIFDQIIDITGYCNGERINDVFGFLLGVYMEGCTALITSEVLKYGNESQTYMSECKTTIQASRTLLIEIFNNCKMESCNKYIPAMTNMIKMDEASNTKVQLKMIFPWFHFVIIMLRKRISSGIALYNLHVFNYLTLSSSDVVYRVLIWSPIVNNTNSGDITYGVGYRENEMEFIYNGIKLHKTTINGLTQFTGSHNNISFFKSVCSSDVNDSENGTDIKDLPSNSQTNNSLAGWKIVVIVLSLIAFVVVSVCCIKCYRRRYHKTKEERCDKCKEKKKERKEKDNGREQVEQAEREEQNRIVLEQENKIIENYNRNAFVASIVPPGQTPPRWMYEMQIPTSIYK